MIVHWGRVNRGRNWHVVVDEGQAALCDPGKLAVEVSISLPPIGGFVCPRCQDEVRDLANAVHAALGQQRPRVPEAEEPDIPPGLGLDIAGSIH